MLPRVLLATIFVFCLAACTKEAGNSSSSSTSSTSSTTSTSSTSSTSSSSSGEVSKLCDSYTGGVFFEGACEGWNEPDVYEQEKANRNIDQIVAAGDEGLLVDLNLVDTGDPNRGTVIDVNYKNNSDYNAISRITAQNIDMSAYAGGELVFDLKVSDLGDSPEGLFIHVGCDYPCQTSVHTIKVDTLDEWFTHRVPVSELVLKGLDLSNIDSVGISPLWGSQNGAQYQVANVHWVEGEAEPIKKCYAQHFNNRGSYILGLSSTDGLTTYSLSDWSVAIAAETVITPQWGLVDEWALWFFDTEHTGNIDDCARSGTISATVSIPPEYTVEGGLQIAFAFRDGNNNTHISPKIEAAGIPAREWVIISQELTAHVPLADIQAVGLAFFNSNGLINTVTDIGIDDIVISDSESVTSSSSSSSSSSSTSSSSGEVGSNCDLHPGSVFIDGSCNDWPNMLAFEQPVDSPSDWHLTQMGEESSFVDITVVDTQEEGYDRVLDIQYKDIPDWNALPRIIASSTRDMSEYAGGEIVFDLRVLDLGDSEDGLAVKIECIYPCESSQYPIQIDALNEWETIRISVTDLIKDGLDITRVEHGIQVYPLWNQQRNVHYQIDNIYWKKGDATVINKCFAQHFGGTSYSLRLGDIDGIQDFDTEGWISSLAAVATLTPQWDLVGTEWGIWFYQDDEEVQSLDSCMYAGTLTAALKLAEEYVQDENFQLAFAFIDQSGDTFYSPKINASALPAGEWATISHELSSDVDYSNIVGIGLAFFGSDNQIGISSPIEIDNIVIAHPSIEAVKEISLSEALCDQSSQSSIFEDCMSPLWLPSIYDGSEQKLYVGESGPNARWSILDLNGGNRKRVIEVEYFAQPGFSNFQFNPLSDTSTNEFTTIDLSEFENGYFVFDLNIVDYGLSSIGLFMHLQCGPACRSRYFPVANTSGVNANGLFDFPLVMYEGEWREIKIPVEAFTSTNLSTTDSDLDISIVDLISITPPWASEDEQYGFRYRLDNIRFEKE